MPPPLTPPRTDVALGADERPAPARNRLLDVVRSVAVVRVVLWHTWSWPWLSWIPAMPAMFFAAGALLEGSLERRGWRATVRQRARRLLLPFWAYGAVCWALMLALGWTPSPAEAVGWFVPVVDPGGSDRTPGLWVPLWYVRAYVWFVLGAGILSWVLRRLGGWTFALTAAATVAIGWQQVHGEGVPLLMGDTVAYGTFVVAGMWYWRGGRVPALGGALVVVAGAAAAVWWWLTLGPDDGVVNRSYALTSFVGIAGLAVVLVFRSPLSAVGGWAGRAVDAIGRRALTIYLWHGLGLVAASWLVDPLGVAWPVRDALALVVVVIVTASAVAVAGPLEDLAAGRPAARPDRRLLVAVPGLAVLLVAAVVPGPRPDQVVAPLSGDAVVARAQAVGEAVSGASGDRWEATDLQEMFGVWAQRHRPSIDRVGLNRVEGAFVTPEGEVVEFAWDLGGAYHEAPIWTASSPLAEPEDPMPWWSITKTATTTWLLRSVEEGTVALDDPLGRWVPEAPHAERISLEDLARHTSGIPGDLDTPFFFADPRTDLEAYAADPHLAFEPGQGFSYSRIGYHLLGLALERATGTTWQDAMADLAAASRVTLLFDDDGDGTAVTDPDGHGYTGMLWASGGLRSTVADGARFFHWVFTEGLTESSRERMTDFSADPDRWFYGLGLMPLCPCESDGDRLRASRYGIDSPNGSVAIDGGTGAALMLRPDSWFDDDGPMAELYELQQGLLDVLTAFR